MGTMTALVCCSALLALGRPPPPAPGLAARIKQQVQLKIAAVPGVAAGQLGVSARAMGAVGNCSGSGRCVDDGPALQRAIFAARTQQRTLLVEAGSYMIRQPLVVPCDHPVTKDCGGAFKMRGEGMKQTIILPGNNMTSLLLVEPGAPTTDRNSPFNMTQDGIELSDIGLHGMGGTLDKKGRPIGPATAQYGLYAAAITRSVFRNVGARFFADTGMFLGFGWCNRIEDCDLSENHGYGLHLKFAANQNNVIGSNIEAKWVLLRSCVCGACCVLPHSASDALCSRAASLVVLSRTTARNCWWKDAALRATVVLQSWQVICSI